MAKNKWVDEEGKFIEPFRKAGEPRDQWQKRVEKAMIESGLFPRLAYASTFKERQRTKLNKINQNKIDKGIARLEELQAKKGTAGEYAASLQIPKVREGILRARNAISPEYEDPNYEKSWKEDVDGYNLYAEGAKKYNEDPVTNENFEERKALENPWSVESLQTQGIVDGGDEVAMQGDRTIFLQNKFAKIKRERAREDLLLKGEVHSLNEVDKGSGGDNDTSYQASLKNQDNNIVDFENTGTEKHWKDMSQWERLQAKVMARGRPQEMAKLRMQRSTFGVTPWNQPPPKDPIEKPETKVKINDKQDNNTKSNDNTSNDGKGGEIFTPAGRVANDDEKKDFFRKSIIGT